MPNFELYANESIVLKREGIVSVGLTLCFRTVFVTLIHVVPLGYGQALSFLCSDMMMPQCCCLTCWRAICNNVAVGIQCAPSGLVYVNPINSESV